MMVIKKKRKKSSRVVYSNTKVKARNFLMNTSNHLKLSFESDCLVTDLFIVQI